MQTRHDQTVETSSKRSWVLPVTAATFLIVVAASFGVLAIVGGDDGASTLEHRVGIVEAQAQAYSDGNVEAWLGYYAPDGSLWNGVFPATSPTTTTWFSAFMAANDQWTIIAPCEEVSADELSCPMGRRDEFHGAAGLGGEGMITFTFNKADEITAFRMSPAPASVFQSSYRPFGVAFDTWLEDTYPDVHAQFGRRVFDVMPNAEDMPIALQHVEEFVAQSKEYSSP